jgi:hypothetical protein
MTTTRLHDDADRLRRVWDELAALQSRLGDLTADLRRIGAGNDVELMAAEQALRRARFYLDGSLAIDLRDA